jgi:hypothetical protein
MNSYYGIYNPYTYPIPQQSLSNEIYSGAAELGRMRAVFSAIFGTLISIFMIIGGIYIIDHRSHMKSIQATVTTDSLCSPVSADPKNTEKSCLTKVKFTVDNNDHFTSVTSNKSFKKDDTVEVYYNPAHPDEDTEMEPIPKSLGWIIIIFAVIILISVWGWVWITNKNKFAAAATGAETAIEVVAAPFRQTTY